MFCSHSHCLSVLVQIGGILIYYKCKIYFIDASVRRQPLSPFFPKSWLHPYST